MPIDKQRNDNSPQANNSHSHQLFLYGDLCAGLMLQLTKIRADHSSQPKLNQKQSQDMKQKTYTDYNTK